MFPFFFIQEGSGPERLNFGESGFSRCWSSPDTRACRRKCIITHSVWSWKYTKNFLYRITLLQSKKSSSSAGRVNILKPKVTPYSPSSFINYNKPSENMMGIKYEIKYHSIKFAFARFIIYTINVHTAIIYTQVSLVRERYVNAGYVNTNNN